MKLLILGGTKFVGRAIAEAALAAGHQLTLFNRGLTDARLFPGADHRRGDRRSDLSALAQGEWDAVLDACGYLPREVEASARLLQGRVGRYLYISSVSAYAGFAMPNRESSPLAVLDDPLTEVVDGASYGPLKAACEAVVRRLVGEPGALIIRPGLVVGPHDPTGRFTYWPAQVAQARDGEPMLVPGAPDDGLQFIDVRDLAAFALQGLERGLTGTFNALAAPAQWSRVELMDVCAAAAGVRPDWVWVDDQSLLAQGLKPWTDVPLWLPQAGEYASFMRCDNRAALAAGLRIRPLAETVADTLAWWRSLPADARGFTRVGLRPAPTTAAPGGAAGEAAAAAG
jgi:2'-hydroxyisoflavone reductase